VPVQTKISALTDKCLHSVGWGGVAAVMIWYR